MDDFGDALYTFTTGLAATVTAATQLKLEFLDTYKTKPPVDVQKNDIAVWFPSSTNSIRPSSFDE